MNTYTATYNGQTVTRSSKTVTYTHVTFGINPVTGEIVDARWSKSAAAASKKLPYGWKTVATVAVTAPATLPAGVFAKNGKLYGPVKALKVMVEAGTAKWTAQGDLIPA